MTPTRTEFEAIVRLACRSYQFDILVVELFDTHCNIYLTHRINPLPDCVQLQKALRSVLSQTVWVAGFNRSPATNFQHGESMLVIDGIRFGE